MTSLHLMILLMHLKTYDVTDICEACFDNGEDCDNDVSEFLENMATCADGPTCFQMKHDWKSQRKAMFQKALLD